MARPEKPITSTGPVADLARALRTLRRDGGSPTYREMATKAHFAASVLSQAAAGHHVPSWEVTVAYVNYFGADPTEYRARWEAAADRTPRRVVRIDGSTTIRKDLGAPVDPANRRRRFASGRRRTDGEQNRWISGGFALVIVASALAVFIAAPRSAPEHNQGGLSGTVSVPSYRPPTTPAAPSPAAQPVMPAMPAQPQVPLRRDLTPDYTVTPLEHLADFAATGPQPSNWDHRTGGDLITSVSHFECTSEQTFTLPRGSERFITVVTAYTNGAGLTVTAIQDDIPTLSTTLVNNQMTRIELGTNHTRQLTLTVTSPTDHDGWCPTGAIKWHTPVIVKRSP